MTDQTPRIEPPEIVMDVDSYIDAELRDAQRFHNRTPLDESGAWSLHALAARIYATGWADGERAAEARKRGERQRRLDSTKDETP